MAKRVSNTYRNLDDTLKLFNFISFRGCGLAVQFLGTLYAINWATRIYRRIFGPLEMVGLFATVAVGVLVLHWVEKHDDEHFVPAAMNYYCPVTLLGVVVSPTKALRAIRERPSVGIYSGARGEGGTTIEEVLSGYIT